MEHIEGQPLQDVIRSKELSPDQVINLTIQLCEGLSKAHQAGVIHRDIKPSNIMIDTDGHARLLDFGLATVAGTDKLTKTGSTLGTVAYMSPEQATAKEIDSRSDIWSLGVVLYEMLTGWLPFGSGNDHSTVYSILNEEPTPISEKREGESEPLEQVVAGLEAESDGDRIEREEVAKIVQKAVMELGGRQRLAVGWYKPVDERWQSLDKLENLTVEELAQKISSPTLVSGELTLAVRETLKRGCSAVLASPAHARRDPAFLAELAWNRWQAGEADDPSTLSPIYLHRGEPIPG